MEDYEYLLQVPYQPGRDFDEDRVHTIKSAPQFKAWTQHGESPLLFVNANLDPPSSPEMSFVSAQAFEKGMQIFNEQADPDVGLIPLAFFCSRHDDERHDKYAHSSEIVMSLLLQLVDRYRDFIEEDLATAFHEFNPEDIESILGAFNTLVSRLPENVILFLIVDGMRSFGRPRRRRDEMVQVVAGLVDICRQHPTKLKGLFANPTRADYLEEIFTNQETLRVPASLPSQLGYNTRNWLEPVDLNRQGGYGEENGGGNYDTERDRDFY